MRCLKCRQGTIFARTPGAKIPATSETSSANILEPLRPFVYDYRCANNLSLWLTVGAPTLKANSGKFYYEVKLGRDVLQPQIGWALDSFSGAERWTGSGVGDDQHSWGADGERQQFRSQHERHE